MINIKTTQTIKRVVLRSRLTSQRLRENFGNKNVYILNNNVNTGSSKPQIPYGKILQGMKRKLHVYIPRGKENDNPKNDRNKDAPNHQMS